VLVLFIFIIILSVFRRYPASAYPFDIIKFSLYQSEITLLFLFVCLFNFVLFYLFYCVIQPEKLKKNMSCSNTTKIVTYLLFQSYQAYFIDVLFRKEHSTGVISEAGTAYLSGAPAFTPSSCYWIFSFLCSVL
jgi:hypothetical protein